MGERACNVLFDLPSRPDALVEQNQKGRSFEPSCVGNVRWCLRIASRVIFDVWRCKVTDASVVKDVMQKIQVAELILPPTPPTA
jgi:hypothetical protein